MSECGFLSRSFEGLNVLVAVPHEDDELNSAGALLYTLAHNGARVTLVYATNGDWKYPAKTRMDEAVRAAGMLGVPEDRILFLGYGDAAAGEARDHLFYHDAEPAVSHAGHRETYGAGKYQDYAFRREGRHHAYTCGNYLADLLSVLRETRPELIIATDFDEHPDHRMLALYVDRAVGLLRREDPSFRPTLWKRFAYCLAYTAEADYSAVNNPETRLPRVGVTEKYGWDLVGSSIYDWDRRIRIPLHAGAREPELSKNLLARVLDCHHSQYIVRKADRILNSDEVYWPRRTDSLGCMAEVTASTGDASLLNDFMLYDTTDVDAPVPPLTGFWQPDGADTEKTARFTWREPVDIARVALFGPMGREGTDGEAELRFSDGTRVTVPILPCGRPSEVSVGLRGITSCEIRLLSGGDLGLAEAEFYPTEAFEGCVAPFCKLLIGDNFAYDYAVDEDVPRLKTGCYRFGDPGVVTIRTEGCRSAVEGDELILDPADRTVTLTAADGTGAVLDRAVIRRLSGEEMERLRAADRKNAAFLQRKRRMYKLHNMLFILRRQGPLSVVKRTVNNVILPRLGRR